MNHATTEIATTAIERSFNISRASSVGSTPTSGTFTAEFQDERHRLSGRPLLRPARRPSATSSSSVECDAEKAARLLLQRRMPPRSGIQAIINQRPARDPWLDDEYDWRP